MSGKVILVGAGCGDFDLITVRGCEKLMHCDAVVYDALIDRRLLDYSADVEKFCVGKRAGGHSVPQEEINELLIRLAREGKTVVRLKGGDPFVFGRGGEEILALQEAGIPYETVPGISAAIAVPELAGIPVTHRKLSRSVHFITAHTADEAPDFAKNAALDGTLVFFMGLRALPEIAEGLIRGGKSADTPSAVISEGATSRQRIVRANLCDIDEKSKDLPAPALVVIGAVSALDFSATVRDPLSGFSVTACGTASFLHDMQYAFAPLGAAFTAFPVLKPVCISELPDLSQYEMIVLTSPTGAELFLEQMRRFRIDCRSLYGIQIAVIGRSTAAKLESAGINPDLIPNKADSESLAKLIAQKITGKALLLRAKNGSNILPQKLREGNVSFEDFPLYETVSAISAPRDIDSDFAVFGSYHGAKTFFEAGCTVLPRTTAVCTGNRTAEYLRGIGCRVIESDPGAENIVNAICRSVSDK